ncbi:zeta toxin family protein [Ghiorsea bivora]|uniref:zeta toxin family protein n=1 Tax=Ghiorsea bivora TaxID=1485545 RepID=UPI00068C27E4|nr:zeta toxin family protein [Ghiorsea bivora]
MNKELAAWIAEHKQVNYTLVVGISGGQGAGKSTLAKALQDVLADRFSVVTLSLDDLYLSQNQRQKLAASIHPLFATRGVPSTHDVQLGIQVLKQLKSGQGKVLLPRFDKQTDNPKPQALWESCEIPVDIVLFEGWCLGLEPQTEAELLTPINSLEATEDKGGVWRNQVNKTLGAEYQRLFQHIDVMMYLQAPSFESIFAWRKQQEQETFAQQTNSSGMDDKALRRFMAHYERLTRHGLTTMPDTADVLLTLDASHHCVDINYND